MFDCHNILVCYFKRKIILSLLDIYDCMIDYQLYVELLFEFVQCLVENSSDFILDDCWVILPICFFDVMFEKILNVIFSVLFDCVIL